MAADNVNPSAERAANQPVPPHSIEAEACVLGSMILHAPAIDIVVQSLAPEHFYRPAHQQIFSSLVEMHNDRKPIDLVSLPEELKRAGTLETIGGVDYLVALAESVPNAANVEYYARIVMEKALLRELILAGTEIVREAYDTKREASGVVDWAEQRVFDIASAHIRSETSSIRDLLQHTFETLENRDGSLVTGLATGYQQLDELTCGFQNGEMIILAARPSMGKTSLLLNMVEYMAVRDERPVALFSLEMSKEQVAQRMLASIARYDLQKMRRGMIRDDDWTVLKTAAGDLDRASVFIDDAPMMTILELRAKARRLKSAHDIACVFIDYLQLMNYVGRADSRQQQITEISRGIKALARELEVPVVAAAQLNRGPADRPGHRPRMSDLRESGSIEQDADLVMLLHNEDYYHRGEPDYQPTGTTELIVAKQRNGPTGTAHLEFLREYTRFEAAAPEYMAPQGPTPF